MALPPSRGRFPVGEVKSLGVEQAGALIVQTKAGNKTDCEESGSHGAERFEIDQRIVSYCSQGRPRNDDPGVAVGDSIARVVIG